jgi:transposase-like protein
MARKKKLKSETDELLDQLLAKCKTREEVIGEGGLLRQLTKRAMERMLSGELTEHLGYEAHEKAEEPRSNTRNGTTPKTVLLQDGSMELEIPRDRDGSFEPQLIRKGQRRLEVMDRQIIALYARGLTTREIQAHLQELYGVEVSPGLISTVTAEVSAEVQAWQNRP